MLKKLAISGGIIGAVASALLPMAAGATTLITAPVASTTMSSLGEWAEEIFTTLSPFAYIALGIMVGGLLVLFFWRKISGVLRKVLGGRKGGRRGRRR